MTKSKVYKIKRLGDFDTTVPFTLMEYRDGAEAVGFVRVSSSGQKDNNSELVQIESIQSYCRSQRLKLVAIFCIVESAKSSEERKIFAKIGSWCERNKLTRRIFYKPDRESRNLTDIEAMLRDVKSGKYEVHYSLDGKVLTPDISPNELFMRKIMGTVDSHYSVELSHKVSTACMSKAKTGWFPGSRPPLGYRNQRAVSSEGYEKRRGSIIVPDTNTQRLKIVQTEFELRSQGYSFEEIRDRVISLGLIEPKKIKEYRAATIARRISNPFYGGYFSWNGKLFKGKHKLIIDPEVYAKAISCGHTSNRALKTQSLFGGGWLKCTCGSSITFERKKKNYRNPPKTVFHNLYRCSNGKGVHKSLKGRYISEARLLEEFAKIVRSISISDGLATEIANELNASTSKLRLQQKKKIRDQQLILDAIERQEDVAYEHFTQGLISENLFKRKLERLKDQRREISATENVSGEQETTSITAKKIIELANNAESLWKLRSPSEKKEFLELILSNYWLDGVTLCFDLKKPFKILGEMASDDKWRTERDSNS
ncbi:recombinase family protein [Bdellovibrio sp. 22V]|uniref:recombinase family protein n=1 Tax=Bdellovibrio sp. 22V TaxID=3044166 RepID=UPI002542D461|nr:recombinase family protein [Bdellovibrio sp. 22V]WII72176.1 recombinase family protein [Bdellovibrio sp. 22V]